MIELSGYDWSLSQTLMVTSILSVCALFIVLLIGQPLYVGLASIAGVWSCLYFWLNKKIADRLAAFEEQLPEALDIMRRMLQAGQPVTQAFNEVGVEMPAPIGVEFKNTFNLLNYGYDMRMAIMQMAEKNADGFLLAFSSAVLLQKETGGNLSENLEKVSRVLRSRFKLQGRSKLYRLKVAYLHGYSCFLRLCCLCFSALLIPNTLSLFTRIRGGMTLVGGGVISLFIGSMWIRNIINFEV